MLAGSVHIAGVINPPRVENYGYWTNPALPQDVEDWLEGAEQHPGSWWPQWRARNAAHAGIMVAARTPGDGALAPIEDAPDSYVRVRAV
jgi:polyhydroxyalkanoate synthase